MIDALKRFLGKGSGNDRDVQQGEHLRDVLVATCALFLEMANVDGQFGEEERESILSILEKDYDLSEDEATTLLATAREELDQSIDLWRFTKQIKDHVSDEEKIHIVEMLWEIIYKDGTLDKHERYLVDKISRLLHLTHEELIAAKLKVLRGTGPER